MDGHFTSLAVARDDQPKKKFVHATDSSRALATQNPRTVQFGKNYIFSYITLYCRHLRPCYACAASILSQISAHYFK